MDPEGQVFGLGQAVIPGFHLTFQHSGVFIPHLIEIIFPVHNGDTLFKVLCIRCHVHETQLEMHGTVKKVQEAAPFLKDLGLVFLLCQLVIDILKMDGLCIIIRTDPADAVLKHTVKRNTLLCGPRYTIIFLRVLYDLPYFFLVLSGQMLRKDDLPLFFPEQLLYKVEHCFLPPVFAFLRQPDGSVLHNSYPSDKYGSSAG